MMTKRVHILGVCVAALGAIHCGSNGNGGGDGSTNDTGNSQTDGGNHHDATNGNDGSTTCNQTLAGSWTTVASGTTLPLTSIYADSASDAWAIGVRTVLHYSGGSWSSTATADYAPSSVAGSSSNDVWVAGITIPANGSAAMGTQVFQHWTGGMFTEMDPTPMWGTTAAPITASALFEVGASDIWVVGAGGTAGHYNGTGWTLASNGLPSSEGLIAVWSPGAGNAVAVGDHTWLWNGTTWSMQDIAQQGEVYKAAWGFGANNIWIAGQYGYIQHWDGTAWTVFDAGANTDLNGIWGSSASDVWFLGDNFAAHWNGTCFQQVTLPTTNVIQAVYGTANNDIWAAGASGTILHFH